MNLVEKWFTHRSVREIEVRCAWYFLPPFDGVSSSCRPVKIFMRLLEDTHSGRNLYYFRGYQTPLSSARNGFHRFSAFLFFSVSFSAPLISHLSDPITGPCRLAKQRMLPVTYDRYWWSFDWTSGRVGCLHVAGADWRQDRRVPTLDWRDYLILLFLLLEPLVSHSSSKRILTMIHDVTGNDSIDSGQYVKIRASSRDWWVHTWTLLLIHMYIYVIEREAERKYDNSRLW